MKKSSSLLVNPYPRSANPLNPSNPPKPLLNPSNPPKPLLNPPNSPKPLLNPPNPLLNTPKPLNLPNSSNPLLSAASSSVLPVKSRLVLGCSLSYGTINHPSNALVDTGAEASCISADFAKSMNLSLIPLLEPLMLGLAAHDESAPTRYINFETPPVQLTIGEHVETIQFLVIPDLSHPIFLAHDWIVRHNPVIDWASKNVIFESNYCIGNCCLEPSASSLSLFSVKLLHEMVYPHFEPILESSGILPEHLAGFSKIFEKSTADLLPEHRIYDCPINLAPGSISQSGKDVQSDGTGN